MRILLANNRLTKRTGTEIVTRDFATGLSRRGHEVAVWSPVTGAMAREIGARGVAVFPDLSDVPFTPDVIHLNQAGLVDAVSARFPGVPSIFQCHVPGEPVPEVIRRPEIRACYGVSPLACTRIEAARGRPADGILGNFVDETLYRPRGPLPATPRRWLVICEKKHGLRHFALVAAVALKRRATLHAIGPRVKRRIANVPEKAADYDLVFASARCAIEAASAGAAVVVTDYRGTGGFLTTDNAAELLEKNFGAECFREKASVAALARAVSAYDAAAAEGASAHIRAHAGLETGLDRLEAIYRGVVAG